MRCGRPATWRRTGRRRCSGAWSAIRDCVVAVAEVEGRVVGAATLLVEHKFINQAGRAGHIEDVAVAVDQQGRGVGGALIRYLLERAATAGCYKTILDCADDVVPFYERLGFRRRTNGMDFRHR